MPSCFKCAVVDQSTGTIEPIGVCATCNSLACYDHGTRMKGSKSFRCVICLGPAIAGRAGVIQHEDYSKLDDDDRGGDTVPIEPFSPAGGPGGMPLPAHAAFETSVLTAHIAEHSKQHRRQAMDIVDDLLVYLQGFAEEGSRAKAETVAVTSDETTVEAVLAIGSQVGRDVQRSIAEERLDPELFADALGVAAWAIGARVDRPISVDRIGLIPDVRLQFALRAWSETYIRAGA